MVSELFPAHPGSLTSPSFVVPLSTVHATLTHLLAWCDDYLFPCLKALWWLVKFCSEPMYDKVPRKPWYRVGGVAQWYSACLVGSCLSSNGWLTRCPVCGRLFSEVPSPWLERLVHSCEPRRVFSVSLSSAFCSSVRPNFGVGSDKGMSHLSWSRIPGSKVL